MTPNREADFCGSSSARRSPPGAALAAGWYGLDLQCDPSHSNQEEGVLPQCTVGDLSWKKM